MPAAQSRESTLAPRLLDIQQAADYLSISKRKMAQLLSSREVPSRKLGRHRRIDRKDLDKFIESLPRGRFEVFDQSAPLSEKDRLLVVKELFER